MTYENLTVADEMQLSDRPGRIAGQYQRGEARRGEHPSDREPYGKVGILASDGL